MKRTTLLLSGLLLGGCGSTTGPTDLPAGPANIAGNYSLTVTMSQACAGSGFPASVMTRTYGAGITQQGASVAVNLTGASFESQGITGSVSGNTVTLQIVYGEFISATEALVLTGAGQGTVNGGSIRGTINGTFTYINGSLFTPNVTCNALDHHFSFTPR